MRQLRVIALLLSSAPCFSGIAAKPNPVTAEVSAPVPADRPFAGALTLAVDATDTDHKIMRVREHIPLASAGPMTLLYPQWETASHAPTAQANTLAGLTVSAGGRPRAWHRDPVNPFAYIVDAPAGAGALDIEFQFLSPVSAGRLAMTPDIVAVSWGSALLYPAGWYARDIPVIATLRLPAGMSTATSLEQEVEAGGPLRFRQVSLETLIDSPVYAGRFVRRVDLGALRNAPVRMTMMADAPDALAIQEPYIAGLRRLLVETQTVFGAPPFQHYDMMVSLSDLLPASGGVEHLRSGENNLGLDFFKRPGNNLIYQDLIAHEFVHSWNGKFRIPEGLWTADANTPSRDDLLWVYEGQTEYWGLVLAARAGLRTRQETLDLLAVKAQAALARTGRSWKSLADSSLDPVFDAGQTVTWPDWQGREGYYVEGVLLWLDVDTLIRERTGGRRSLDDFAQAFFRVDEHGDVPRTYTLGDLCAALARVTPLDWRSFFDERLNAHDNRYLLNGLRRGGYALAYAAAPSEAARQAATDDGGLDLRASLGLLIADGGRVRRVSWEGLAFRAGIGVGAKLTLVNGAPYTDETLVQALRSTTRPVRLGFFQDGYNRLASIDVAAPRYPELRGSESSRSLDTILTGRVRAAGPQDQRR